jgi:hypothetical protein
MSDYFYSLDWFISEWYDGCLKYLIAEENNQ